MIKSSEKEKDALYTGALLLSRAASPKRVGTRGAALLALLTVCSLLLGLFSVLCARVGDREGELSRAVSFVEDLATESEVLAVFLGLGELPLDAEEVDTREDEIARRAEEYIHEHNASSSR